MRKFLSILVLCLIFLSTAFAGKAILLTINGPIGPATQDYIQRGIGYAEDQSASLILLQIDTPGGLESAVRQINQSIIASPIPVVSYVAPSGARAASAGTYLVYASHLSVMAPGTNIGSATPINLLDPNQNLKPADKKILNDAVAYIRSLAEMRGRNADWAEQSVRNADNISAEKAKKLNVIDEIAVDYPHLLQQINGKTVTVNQILQKIQTTDLQIEPFPQDWRYDFLSFITNPNVAYILLLIAIYGLFFEFSTPGTVLPGVVGIISLLLVMYAFQLMPINYTGLILVVLGIAFMLFEVYVSSFGIVGIGGAIAFILGSIFLFDANDPNYHLTLRIIAMMSLITIAFFLVLLSLAYRSHKQAVITGKEGFIGSEGQVLSVMNEQVIVRVAGEIWEARSSERLKAGDEIVVKQINGLILTVARTHPKRITS